MSPWQQVIVGVMAVTITAASFAATYRAGRAHGVRVGLHEGFIMGCVRAGGVPMSLIKDGAPKVGFRGICDMTGVRP